MKGNRPKLLHIALGLAFSGMTQQEQQQGYALRDQLRFAYYKAGAGKRTNAAQQQRAAKKLRNIRARASKRSA